MSGDHSARLKCLDRVEGSNPLAAGLRIGLGEVEVNAVIGGVRVKLSSIWRIVADKVW
jgi:hypothetical protein